MLLYYCRYFSFLISPKDIVMVTELISSDPFLLYFILLLHHTDSGNKPYAHQMVRTDSKEQKLDAFFKPNTPSMEASANQSAASSSNQDNSCKEPQGVSPSNIKESMETDYEASSASSR